MDNHTTLSVGVNTSALLAWQAPGGAAAGDAEDAPAPAAKPALKVATPALLRLKMHLMKSQHLQPHLSQQPSQVAMPKTSWP
jgi:hypothetical protein